MYLDDIGIHTQEEDRRSWDVWRELKDAVMTDGIAHMRTQRTLELFGEMDEYMEIDEGSDVGGDMSLVAKLETTVLVLVFVTGVIIGAWIF